MKITGISMGAKYSISSKKTESRIVVDDVVVDTQSRVVTKGGEPVSLTAKEYNLLILFLQNKNIALFRETIYERVWENDYMGDRVFQSDAPGVAHRLVGDAEHLHLLLGHGDLPVQGGAEGDADEQVAPHPDGEHQDAQRRQGDLPGEPHSLTSRR